MCVHEVPGLCGCGFLIACAPCTSDQPLGFERRRAGDARVALAEAAVVLTKEVFCSLMNVSVVVFFDSTSLHWFMLCNILVTTKEMHFKPLFRIMGYLTAKTNLV